MSELLISTDGPVARVTLNRPKQLNALNLQLMQELVAALEAFDADEAIRVIVLAGSERAFAAGADVHDMAGSTVVEQVQRNQFARWERIRRIRKPIIAAVSGFCLGGGCELAMHCDLIIASETAQFGQPEINLGVMPGAGGTQRLTRAVGKAAAMDVILTGRFLTAQEALAAGVVSRVVPKEHFLSEAMKVARQIAEKAPLAVRFAKEAVLKAHETPLSEGLEYERKLFYLLFATEDQKEGMKAFIEKRSPTFRGA
ncbi:MAG: enoyl-CoA hydratase/isomerase family protein [Phycisphaerales bacterium]|nr:enoyl-CoA hydratase/isomerase family protein [Phycisphaerales bacterium]